MELGTQISIIRKEQALTQEQFGTLFHVTRQTVSNWENRKSYPDLQTLIAISNRFDVSLDTLLKGDTKMIQKMDRERLLGKIRHDRSVIDFFTGSGTGIVASCLFSPASAVRTLAIVTGFVLIGIGWYQKAKHDKAVLLYLEAHESK